VGNPKVVNLRHRSNSNSSSHPSSRESLVRLVSRGRRNPPAIVLPASRVLKARAARAGQPARVVAVAVAVVASVAVVAVEGAVGKARLLRVAAASSRQAG
jgi:hypothetical protein